jgi:hypothetical protein
VSCAQRRPHMHRRAVDAHLDHRELEHERCRSRRQRCRGPRWSRGRGCRGPRPKMWDAPTRRVCDEAGAHPFVLHLYLVLLDLFRQATLYRLRLRDLTHGRHTSTTDEPSSAGELAARQVMAAFRGWRVRAPLHDPTRSDAFWVLFSLGGMCGAIVTSPFDVVKTRLQSSLFQQHTTARIATGSGTVALAPKPPGGLLYNFVETGHILR